MRAKNPKPIQSVHERLLGLLAGRKTPTPEQFRELVLALDNHRVLAKVFLLEGTPAVFKESPMKYVIFREQVADRFNIGSQDVCIVGSAKLGYSPSPHKFGTPFAETSDVDVVIISEPLFYRGSRELFDTLNDLVYSVRPAQTGRMPRTQEVAPWDWLKIKDSIRNFVYQNFNPGLLPQDHPLRREVFENMASTSGLFLALEPQVFVSKIRCRVFRTWKGAEDYYSNSLREARFSFIGEGHPEIEVEDAEDLEMSTIDLPIRTTDVADATRSQAEPIPVTVQPSPEIDQAVPAQPACPYGGMSVRWAILRLLAEDLKEAIVGPAITSALQTGGSESSSPNFARNVSAVLRTMANERQEVEQSEAGYLITPHGQDVWAAIKRSPQWLSRSNAPHQ
jgi:hypothetical protein